MLTWRGYLKFLIYEIEKCSHVSYTVGKRTILRFFWHMSQGGGIPLIVLEIFFEVQKVGIFDCAKSQFFDYRPPATSEVGSEVTRSP